MLIASGGLSTSLLLMRGASILFKMAHHSNGFTISSPTKRLKLSRDYYSEIYRRDSNHSKNFESFRFGEMAGDDGEIRENDRPPNTSPDPFPMLGSRLWSHSSFNDCADHNGGSGLGVTSTSDGLLAQELDLINGGDSGFTDLTPPGSAGCAESSGIDADEPDSSTSNCKHNEGDPVHSESSCEEDDSDEVASTISGLSGLSDISGEDWNPVAQPLSLVQRHIASGMDPRTLLQTMLPQSARIPDNIDDITLWKIIIGIVNEPPQRRKLPNMTTFSDVLTLLRTCNRIIVLTGAGVSVSCGIPDFRSKNGIYARLAKDFPDLPDPQAMFDFQYFKKDPRPFYKFAKEIYPGQYEPSPCHRFIKYLEDQGKLLRNYTQNIDTLERVAGIQRVIECHGSFATASCVQCKYQVDLLTIKEDIFNQTIPRCPRCSPSDDKLSIMKPDIVFFGEGLSDEFHSQIAADKDDCDLLIVIGSSLKVRPVALIPSSIPPNVPQILINREQLLHVNFDVELLGDCDVIINEICYRLGNGWNSICYTDVGLTELTEIPKARTALRNTRDKDDDDICDEDGNLQEGHAKTTTEAISEHSNDPCDSTSFPHRYKEKTSIDDEAGVSSSFSLQSPNVEVQIPATTVEDPDSTNVNENMPSNMLPGRAIANVQERSSEVAETSRASSSSVLFPTPFRIASRLPENTYLFYSHRRYIFHGAEVCDSDYDSDVDMSHDESASSEITDNEADDIVPSPSFNDDDDDDSRAISPDQGLVPCAASETASSSAVVKENDNPQASLQEG